MPPSIFDAPLYAFVVVLGVSLIILARWAARRHGTRWESLVALRVGDVLFTEVVGAFLIGFGIGALIAPQLDSSGPAGPPGRPVPPSRFGGALSGNRLPFILGVVLAAISAAIRIDWTDHLLRGPSAHNALSTYIGCDAGMVAIPVRLYLATESTSKVSFNLLCPEHKARIKNKRWCPEGDHEVAWGDVVRGYEYEKGSYVELDDADLDKLPLHSSKAIDIAGFIEDKELPGELYYQSAYYLEPEKSAAKPYALLKKTLEKTDRVAIAKFALRDRERLVSVRSHDGALVMNTLHWPDEIRSTEELELPDDVKVSPAEAKMAENLVGMMAMKFRSEEHTSELQSHSD